MNHFSHNTLYEIQCFITFLNSALCSKSGLWKNNCVSRKPCKRRSDLILNGQMRVPNKPCYLENRVVREPCKRRTACILFVLFVLLLLLLIASFSFSSIRTYTQDKENPLLGHYPRALLRSENPGVPVVIRWA